MLRAIRATVLIRFTDQDSAKAERLRAKLLRKEMRRRDKRGRVLVLNRLDEEKPRKPRKTKPPEKPPEKPAKPKARRR